MHSRRVSIACLLLTLLGCATSAATVPIHVSDGTTLQTEGIARCSSEQPERIEIDPNRPVVVLVHGCFSSGSHFKKLADVFAFHDQQVLCFNYNERDSLRAMALRLQNFLYRLSERLRGQTVTVIGHSQGGMISRIALSDWNAPPPESSFRLVTVSSPLAGIDAAEHCGWTGLHVLTLGITVAVCTAIVGAPWTEIPPNSRIWAEPLPLFPEVREHLTVMTDERGSCRRRDSAGTCVSDDYVFSLVEQRNPRLTQDPRVRLAVVRAGHAEIVGEGGQEPTKLITLLQSYSVLASTPAHLKREFAKRLPSWF